MKLSPTRNMTLLVTSRHPVREYRHIASQLLSAAHVHAEQVGFLLPPASAEAHARLHMAGDEFCGNACMALAALKAAERDLVVSDRAEIVLEASGAEAFVRCSVERQGPGYRCELSSPLPSRVEPYPFPGVEPGLAAVVRYADAVHLVVECTGDDRALRERAQQVAAYLGTTEAVSVVGVMLYDPHSRQLTPLINVPSLNSMVWERSCGSGTASVGAYLAAKARGPVSTGVRQPGGAMHLRAEYGQGGLETLQIAGHVRLVAEGRAYVHG